MHHRSILLGCHFTVFLLWLWLISYTGISFLVFFQLFLGKIIKLFTRRIIFLSDCYIFVQFTSRISLGPRASPRSIFVGIQRIFPTAHVLFTNTADPSMRGWDHSQGDGAHGRSHGNVFVRSEQNYINLRCKDTRPRESSKKHKHETRDNCPIPAWGTHVRRNIDKDSNT